MHDIKWIREHPEAFDEAMKKRGLEPQSAGLVKLDEEYRGKQTRLQELQQQRNEVAKKIGAAKKAGEDAEPVMIEASRIKEEIAALEAEIEEGGQLKEMLSSLPNIPHNDVPVGKDEADNKEIRRVGEPKQFSFTPKQHFEIGETLGQMDFETAAKMSGSRFVLLSAQLARLERALASFMLDLHTQEFGYTEVVPPYLVRDNAMYGSCQLPKFAEDSFQTTNGYWLIATSEISLANIVADEILSEDYLPRRYTAFTPCFRSEAGSAGKDTRGMIRQHQFSKVELVSVTHPDKSEQELERMTGCAEEVLKRLGLPYRVMLLCSGDMGFGARKTYDLEVWLPGQDAYREISSCSVCGDFQARRMRARFRKEGEKGTQFVHTLNGSGLAVGRTLVAVLENYQNEDGSVTVPEALVPYMGGASRIG